jgi:hypothetical protein
LGLGAVLRDRPFGYAGVEIQGVRGHYFTNFGQMIRCGNGAVLAASRLTETKRPYRFKVGNSAFMHRSFLSAVRAAPDN